MLCRGLSCIIRNAHLIVYLVHASAGASVNQFCADIDAHCHIREGADKEEADR